MIKGKLIYVKYVRATLICMYLIKWYKKVDFLQVSHADITGIIIHQTNITNSHIIYYSLGIVLKNK